MRRNNIHEMIVTRLVLALDNAIVRAALEAIIN